MMENSLFDQRFNDICLHYLHHLYLKTTAFTHGNWLFRWSVCVYTPTHAYACPLCLQLTVTPCKKEKKKKSQMTRGVVLSRPAEDPDLRVTFSS